MRKRNYTVFCFEADDKLRRSVSRHFGNSPSIVRESHFASGEIRISVTEKLHGPAILVSPITEHPSSLVKAVMLASALRRAGATKASLVAPWIAYGRQDGRDPNEFGAGLVVANLLSTAFDQVTTLDAHSEPFRDSFQGRLTNVLPDLRALTERSDLVIAPDEGSIERASHAAHESSKPLVVFSKKRMRSGRVVTQPQRSDKKAIAGARVVIIDDIADTAGTLVAAASAAREGGAASIRIIVTHAVDMKLLRSRMRTYSDDVHVVYDHGSGYMQEVVLPTLIGPCEILR